MATQDILNVTYPDAIEQLERNLESTDSRPYLKGGDGTMIPLTIPENEVLLLICEAMREGKSISLVPAHSPGRTSERVLTSQQAAKLLNVSRPFLIEKLLKTGVIPHLKVGNRHRIRYEDVIAYKQERDESRRQILREHTQLLEEEGFYDE